MSLDTKGEAYNFDDGPYFRKVKEMYAKLRTEIESAPHDNPPTTENELSEAKQGEVRKAS
jgi:hypothetical protein